MKVVPTPVKKAAARGPARSPARGKGGAKVTEQDSVPSIIAQWQRERPDLDPTPMALFGALARAYLLTAPMIERLLAGYGLARGMFDVMAALRRAGAPYCLTPTQLSRSLMLSGAGMTNRLDRLQALHLVGRRPDPNDRRGLQIHLTPKGQKLVESILPEFLDLERRVIAEFGLEKVNALTDLLLEFHQRLGPGAARDGSA